MARAFQVGVAREDAGSAELEGAELASVAMLLRIASGVPRFDLEFGGRMFRGCTLSAMPTEGSIPFNFESTSNLEL